MRRYPCVMRTSGVLGVTLAVALATAVAAGAAPRPKAPAIAGLTLEGKRITLAQFRGRPVLINVWSSW